MAEDVGLDLVEISPNASPPVCKIIENYRNKEKLYLERAIRHDYFAGHYLITNKGTKQ